MSTAYTLRLDPVLVVTEPDPRRRAVRIAAAHIILEAKREAAEKAKTKKK